MTVTAIIPTTCDSSRGPSLRRAILSIVDQVPDNGLILVVANGDRIDEAVVRMAQEFPRTRVERLEKASVAKAQQLGRRLVRTEYFCFLDDDDEYLPGAVTTRLNEIHADSSVDVVVTNGFEDVDNSYRTRVEFPEAARTDPLRALLQENWLASCGGFFRTQSVTPDYFDGRTCFLEWTLLAYKLASNLVIRFIDVPTYRIHSSHDSASKSQDYREAQPRVLATIANLDLPPDVRRAVKSKISNAEHSLSTYFLRQGDLKQAVCHHVRSLGSYSGLKFLPYSRKLLRIRPNGWMGDP